MSSAIIRVSAVAVVLATAALVTKSESAVRGQENTTKPTTPQSRLDRFQEEIDTLRKRCEALETADKKAMAAAERDSLMNPVVGSITAYVGSLPADRASLEEWESKTGWMLCDGRDLTERVSELKDLSLALTGSEKSSNLVLPDLRGVFLRGLDRGRGIDRDRPLDFSIQDDTTRMPRNAFKTSEEPERDLAPQESTMRGRADFGFLLCMNGDKTASGTDRDGREEPNIASAGRIKKVPPHSHKVEGGDSETRPVNVSVHWIIKVRPAR